MDLPALFRWIFEAVARIVGLIDTERLRRLGRLEERERSREKSDEDARKGAEIDAAPDERDPRRLFDRLRSPRKD